MGPQNRESPNFDNLDVGFMERYKVYYKGEGGGFPQVRDVVSLMYLNCPWLVLTPKVLQLCINHLAFGFVQVCGNS